MTRERFRNFVLQMANQMPVRYFMYPDGPEPPMMGLQLFPCPTTYSPIIDRLFKQDMAKLGFTLVEDCIRAHGYEIWQIERTDK